MSTDPRLVAIGDALERAVAAELKASRALATGSRLTAATEPHGLPKQGRRWWRRRRAAVLSVALAIALPGAALAAKQLIWTNSQVAASLPQGTLALGGTDPTCTTVIADVEYHCTLAKAPASMSGAPAAARRGVTGKTATVWFYLTSTLRKDHIRALRLEHVKLITKHGRRALVVSGKRITLPYQASAPSATTTNGWLGTDEATVDSSKHVNGGCRSLNAAGTAWECYLGEAAVRQKIISQGFLGTYAPTPGVG